MVSYSTRAPQRGDQQGAFDFLGVTFYRSRSRREVILPTVKTSGKRLRAKLKTVRMGIRQGRTVMPLKQIGNRFQANLHGHSQRLTARR